MEQKIIIKNRKGQKLSAIHHIPKKTTTKIIILTHSFKGDKNYQPIMRDFSRKAEANGYAVIRFDCYGSGKSEGSFEDASIMSEVEDLQDVIEFAQYKGYSDICLIGLSLGATVSVLAYEEKIKSLVLWSPAFELKGLYESYKKEILEKGYIIRERNLTGEKVKVGRKMWEDFGKIKSYQKLNKIKSPTLVIIGSKDSQINFDKTRKYVELIPVKKKLDVIPGGDHDFLIKEAEEKAISLSLDWIKEYL